MFPGSSVIKQTTDFFGGRGGICAYTCIFGVIDGFHRLLFRILWAVFSSLVRRSINSTYITTLYWECSLYTHSVLRHYVLIFLLFVLLTRQTAGLSSVCFCPGSSRESACSQAHLGRCLQPRAAYGSPPSVEQAARALARSSHRCKRTYGNKKGNKNLFNTWLHTESCVILIHIVLMHLMLSFFYLSTFLYLWHEHAWHLHTFWIRPINTL